jgi:hypothetical protein
MTPMVIPTVAIFETVLGQILATVLILLVDLA